MRYDDYSDYDWDSDLVAAFVDAAAAAVAVGDVVVNVVVAAAYEDSLDYY